MAVTIMASAGSFAAISTLLGSPLLGAFLIMEAAGIAGATLSLVALPGLLASGIGALVFLGLDAWTGLGTFSLALTTVPPGVDPTVATLLWAVPVGLLGALLGWAVRWVGLTVRPLVHRNRVPVTVGLGALIGLTAMAYQLITGKGFTEVLFSGQDALPNLVANAADYSVATLVVLGLCKMLAYGLSLSAFRGGPVFPAMFVGAVLGIAMSGLPGMSLAPAIGMGIGAMCCAMLRLPLTSVLLATLLLGSDGLQSTPEVIVAVVVAFVAITILPTPGPASRRPASRARPPGCRHARLTTTGPHRPSHPVGVSRCGEGHSIVDGSAAVEQGASQMTVRPARLNAAIAWLFMVGSACFVLGSVPAYAEAVGGWVDGVTYFVGSIFFTSASFCQLVQAQSPAMTGVDARRPARARAGAAARLAARTTAAGSPPPPSSPAPCSSTSARFAALAHNATAGEADRYVWRPDLFGSVLFLVASAYGILAVSGRFLAVDAGSLPWRIAWINMLGSVLFMASALASYVLPSTDEVLDTRLSVAGTLLGAVCFLVGAALMLPAWRRDLRPHPGTRSTTP